TTSIDSIRQLSEKIQTALVKKHLLDDDGALMPEVKKQVQVIIQSQMRAGFVGEVFGTIMYDGDKIALPILETDFAEKVHQAIKDFGAGDNSGIPVLKDCLQKFTEIHGSYLEKEDIHILLAKMAGELLISAEQESEKLDEVSRKWIVST